MVETPCPRCKTLNAANAAKCGSCGTVFEESDTITSLPQSDSATITSLPAPTSAGASFDVPSKWSRATRIAPLTGATPSLLAEGDVLAERYEIIQLLGEGGMGAVYKARDRELDRLVAIKLIRSELAGHASVLQRFKQELILARKITHRNVIRIYDLGVADGFRFITMEYVEGQDLSSLMEGRQTVSPEETVKILRQVCGALEAAHSEGVVHRDLKPQNIMIDTTGRACVMDFGLARSLEATGLTQVGAVMGTPSYMSPEQAKGLVADERSDIFSLGVIAYQMLTGVLPYKGDTALATMLLRTQGPPKPPTEHNPALPQVLSDIVLKMLGTDPADRYASAAQLDHDLHAWQDGVLHQGMVTPQLRMIEKPQTRRWVGLAIAVVVIAGLVYGAMRFIDKPAAEVPPMTLIIADFNNHTNEAVFSGTLESTLKLALEGASFISAYDRTRMRDLGVPAPEGALTENQAQAIAAAQGLNVVVSGSIDRSGDGYQLALRALQTVTGKVLATAEADAANKDQVLFAVTKLATTIRQGLGDSTSESDQRFAMETLSAASLEAIHEYAVALDALSTGRNDQAHDHFAKAVDLDPNFGLAYAGMASAAHNLGRAQEAEDSIKQAITHIDRMTERERFRTRAYLYLLIGDPNKCVDEYASLLTKYKSDTGAMNNAAVCLTQLRKIPEALDDVGRAAQILPKRATYRVNLAFYNAYDGKFDEAAKDAQATLALNPAYPSGFLATAFAALGQEKWKDAADAYGKLSGLRPSDGAMGIADLAAFEGRYAEAAKILEQGAKNDVASQRPDSAADKYVALAHVQSIRGQKAAAVAAVRQALALSTAPKIQFLAGRVLIDEGETSQARELADQLSGGLIAEPQSYAKLLDGLQALKAGNPQEAIQLFGQANKLLDTWISRYDLGRAYLENGSYIEADSEFDRCLQRKGEALALFLDEVPTFSFLPTVYYYQGKVRENLKSANFSSAYAKYVELRGAAGEDPLLADSRRGAKP